MKNSRIAKRIIRDNPFYHDEVGIKDGQVGENKTDNAAGVPETVSHKRHLPSYAFTKLKVFS